MANTDSRATNAESLLHGVEEPVVRTALIEGATFGPRAVQYIETEGLAVFEGDIVLGEAEKVAAAADQGVPIEVGDGLQHGVVISGERYRWPQGVVPYEIDSALPNQQRVTDAIAHWHDRTRVRLVLRTAANAAQYPDFVRFRPGSGCSSYVGRQGGGMQPITLTTGCTTGNTIHEIGHAVGLWHEQSREDRDRFVEIRWANITPGFESNFAQHVADGDDVGAYDYGSIMHYPQTAFSRNGQDTIVPRQAGVVIGQRTGLSPGDVAAVRWMYPNLEPSSTWRGVQFRGTVPANGIQRWFTFNWPAHWYVSWLPVPLTPGRRISCEVQVERQAVDRFLTYHIGIRNHSAQPVEIEARYEVHGWTPVARDVSQQSAATGDHGALDAGAMSLRLLEADGGVRDLTTTSAIDLTRAQSPADASLAGGSASS